jgi:gamma-glutamyltranspeptidase
LQEPNRLHASGSHFAIATPHARATVDGMAAFRAGGTAVDAALAASATLAVAYPHMTGIGGDLFALVGRPDGTFVSVNGSGAAPAIDPAVLRWDGGEMPLTGPLTITVPGAVAAWETLARLGGKLGLADAIEPAIRHARDGVEVPRSLATAIANHEEALRGDAGCEETFLPQGQPLREGEILQQPALARSLEIVAGEGASALYGGDLGLRLVQGLARMGSPLTLGDLAAHRTDVGAPLVGSFGEREALTCPPNSQGFVLLEILAAWERLNLDLDPLGPSAAVLAGLFGAASMDRDRFLADPRRADVPVDDLLAEPHLEELCRAVLKEPERPQGIVRRHVIHGSGDTVAIVAADAEGWTVSMLQSLFHSFGSGILEPATGILCHNRGSLFSLDPRSPNVIEGGKRPAHTLMPAMVTRAGAVEAVVGTMGVGRSRRSWPRCCCACSSWGCRRRLRWRRRVGSSAGWNRASRRRPFSPSLRPVKPSPPSSPRPVGPWLGSPNWTRK